MKSCPQLSLRAGELWFEEVSLKAVAEQHGTPAYVYSRRTIVENYRAYRDAFATCEHLICYAVKANPNLAILQLLAREGAGFDIVSEGELRRVLAAGGDPGKVIFSGVGKRESEIAFALSQGIACFNVESEAELERIDAVAQRLGRRAPIALRVNPDVDAKTHPYIATGLKENKFGVAYADAERLYRFAAGRPTLEIRGIECHIGSMITELAPYQDAIARLLDLVDRLAQAGIALEHIDVGGGRAIVYRDEEVAPIERFAEMIRRQLGQRRLRLLLEPGRSIVGNAGLLLTRIELLKPGPSRNFAVVDAAMNDLIRPTLYGAYHAVVEVAPRAAPSLTYDIVGPVCESGDWLARDRPLSAQAGDLLAILGAGAYGMTMASNYNSRLRPCELLVDGEKVHVIRERERFEELIAGERLIEG
ncbi:MAG: diaminopimelate decarboxylase [Casimicrobiaceae bacterium]|nr:diaminopimelate decarboxylase [Casimicrobiaceae bacterium]MCX8098503.1 diaminopimelate decarboxylase [Casimicrobiaceae bacterium]MDW8311606.1 diaminopimelate decarboxylase [Burkholderiales bacterium]